MRKTRASRRNLLVVFAALGIATGVLHPVGAEAKETMAGIKQSFLLGLCCRVVLGVSI